MLNLEEFSRTTELFDGHYRLLRPLSTDGGTADVWLAIDTNTIDDYPLYEDVSNPIDESTGVLVAIKIYRPKNALDIEGQQRFRDEYKIVHECRHANLLQPTNFSIFKETPYLVLPYCEAGSAEKFIGQKVPTETIWKFILEVASGLDRLHTNHPQIVHQDIKPANILIDNNGSFTITDFGISTIRTNDTDYIDDENSGTRAYMAPERFDSDATPLPQSDIWAFGATLCEIITGQVPFGEEGGLNQRLNKTIMVSLSGVPKNIRKLIKACLEKDPRKRPSARQIVETAQAKKQNSSLLSILIAVGMVAMAVIVYFFLINSKEPTPEIVADFAHAEVLLSTKQTAKEGLELLQSLVEQNDYQATFLMSRLFFDSSDPRDTIFYNRKWNIMRVYSDIRTDNRQAHDLLMRAFELNDYDYVMLYQLGSDFLSGERRGCERNLAYASWCFEQAENSLVGDNSSQAKIYLDYLHKGKQRTEGVTAKRPRWN